MMLAIGPEEKAAIQRVREQAAANPVDMKEVERRARLFLAGDLEPVPNPSLELPVGFFVSYSVEVHPIGPCRHISISVQKPGRVPIPASALMILDAFGFAVAAGSALVLGQAERVISQAVQTGRLIAYPEDCGGGRQALNFVESLDGKLLR